jgi:hypothetical protein
MLNPKEFSLREEVPRLILHGIALSLVTVCTYPFLPETFARWTGPRPGQPSLDVALYVEPHFVAPMMFSLIACLFYLRFYGRNRLPGSAIRVGIAAVMVVMVYTSVNSIEEGRKILDREILEVLAPLRVGMPRSEVEALVLRSNMRVADMHEPGLIQGERIGKFRSELRQHWERAQGGETGMLVFDVMIPFGLFAQRIHSHSIGGNAEIYVDRSYYMFDAGTSYRLGLRFDSQDRLESAGYRRLVYSDETVLQCEVIFQRSATNPVPCDPTSY